MTIAVNAGARLDRLPISRFHWRIVSLIGAGMFLDGFEIYLAGGVLGALVKSGWSDLAHNAQFISATFLGMMIGAWASGLLGDHYGRRFSYQVNLLLFGVAALAGAVAPSMFWLIVARFFMGVGLGAEIVVGYSSLSEFVPPQARGRWIGGLAVVTNSALFVSAMASYLIIPNFGWRWMFAIVGVGALIVWYLRKAMPESPRWLESVGRFDEAERVMTAIEAEAWRGATPPAAELDTAIAPAPVMRPLTAIFSRQMLARTVVGTLVACVTNAAIYGFVAWLPTFFVKQGMGIVGSLGFTTLMSFGGPCGALIALATADRFGRKPLLMGAAVAAVVFGIAYPLVTPNVAGTVPFVLVGFALVTAIYVQVGGGFAIYLPELYPTELRMRGVGFCNTLGRITGMAMPYIILPIYASHGVGGVTLLVSALLAVMFVGIGIWGVETRQRPLEALAPEGAPLGDVALTGV